MRARRKAKRKRRLRICVDPGIAGTGIALLTSPPLRLVHTEVIKSSPDLTWIERCYWIAEEFYHALIEYTCIEHIYPHDTVKVYIEIPAMWGSSGRSYAAAASGDLLQLCVLTGMLMLTCHRLRLTCIEAPVGKWKGQLSKAVVKKRVMEAFGLKKIPNHAADAAGIGLWVAGRM